MATSSFNPTSTSGIGFKLEHYVQVAYLSSLIVDVPVPFSDILSIKELLFQAKHVANTDDLIVNLDNGTNKFKHYLQSKKGFEINKNKTFDQVIDQAYKDFKQTSFKPKDDKFIIFTDVLTKTDSDDSIPMLEWARFSKNAADFSKKLTLNKSKHNKYVYFKNSLELAAGKKLSADEIWKFLKCFYVKAYDYLSSAGRDKEVLKWFLKPHLNKSISPDTALLKLLEYVQICNQNGASITIENVPDSLKQLFNSEESNKIGSELKELFRKSKSLVGAIENTIDDHHLARDEYFIEIDEAIHQYKLVMLTGDGGVGKSAVIKDYLDTAFGDDLGYISFKGDILDKSSLAQSLSEIGVHNDIETLIGQWQHLSNLIIYIDSFEKLYESDHPEAFTELLKKVKDRQNITILATCRSYAFETLRKKFKIGISEISNIPVKPLTDQDLNKFAIAKPQISALLANPKLRNLLSLPYFLGQAISLAETIGNSETINEADFKNAIWDRAIEKTGFGKLGHSQIRGLVFSKIILNRAKERQSFIGVVQDDLPIAEELHSDGLLIKHPLLYKYAPKHDVLEDLAIARFLDEQFAEKINVKTFLVGIDTNPVIRRGIRIWVQQFLLKSKDEGIQFLTEALQLPKGENPIVDELLIGILGSDHCFELMVINEQLILANNLQIFDKLFQLAKLAYVLPYPLKNPKRSLLSIGPSWNALVKFLGKNYIAYKNDFDISLVELFQHWMLQFEVDDQLPEESRIVADQCLSILSAIKTERVIHNVKDVLEIFFWVIPVAQTEAKAFIDNIKEITIAKRTDSEYPIGFVRELNKLLIVDVYRCEKVYQYFPNEIIELAKVEWYSNKEARIDSSSYTESSFGLVSHPYNYFSASKYQTPFRFLFKYHFDQALQFLIELTNRGMAFYVRAEYTSELEEIEVILNDGQKVKQIGNYSLFSAYRGDSTIPYLIQSALMAFESNLLERAGDGETFDAVFQTVMVQSRTVLLTGVLISVATAYPFIFGDNIDALFKVRLLFAWDLTRYSGDYSITHHTSTIGNDFYYTGERHESNLLPHRRRNLEMLVTHRQLYFPEKLNVIIDGHLKELNPKDQLWQLALIRMDIRNTVPELLEDEQKIAFIPKPLPKDIQSMIDETSANQNHDVNAISIHLYANKLLKNEYDSLPEIDEWREQYRKLIGIDFKQVALFSHPDVELALVGIRFFSVELTPEELVYCIQKIIPLFTEIEHNTQLLKQPFDQRENDSVVHILPKLLSPEFADLVDRDKIKEVIKIVILFGHGDLFSQLITGIKTWAWDYDYEFAAFCFQLLLKKAYHDGFGNLIPRFYQKNESEQMQIVNDLKNEIEVASPVTIEQINLTEGDKFQLVQAFSLVPFHLLSNEYYPFLEEILKQLREFSNLEDYNDHQFVSLLEILLADFILFEFNDNTSRTVYRVLMLFDKHYQFVLNIFERITALAHDSNYPEVLWKQFDLVLNYFIQVSPKIAFLKILFLFSLHHPQTARKLNPAGPNKILHEQLISDAGMADRNITGDLFQLLAGIGSVYQPDSLRWLMKSFPTQEIYHSSLSAKAVSSMEKYVTQIFDTHLIYLKQNKDLLDYFILMLNALTTFGSRKAFRIRDIII